MATFLLALGLVNVSSDSVRFVKINYNDWLKTFVSDQNERIVAHLSMIPDKSYL